MLNRIKQVLSNIQVHNVKEASLICKLIPSACPFARTIHLGKHQLVIPPLCKFNPLYEEFMELRFKADCYLAERV